MLRRLLKKASLFRGATQDARFRTGNCAQTGRLSSPRKPSSLEPRGFSVVSGATSQMHSPSSGRKKTFILAFGGTLFVLRASAFVQELLSAKMRYTLQSLRELDSERLWGVTRRPPLIQEKKSHGSTSTSLTVRVLLPLLEGMSRTGASLVAATLRRRKRKVSKQDVMPDVTDELVEANLTT